jgi:hypothetical protein
MLKASSAGMGKSGRRNLYSKGADLSKKKSEIVKSARTRWAAQQTALGNRHD